MIKVAPSPKLLRALSRSLGDPVFPSTPSRSLCRHLQTSHRPSITRKIPRSRNTARTVSRRHVSSSSTSQNPTEEPFAASTSPAPPDISTHYTIFPQTLPQGPPPGGPFNIPLPTLRREFLALQALHHPDKYGPTNKSRAEALSARINEAYRTLRDPLLRAQYLLLHVYGVDVTNEDNSAHPADPGTLAVVMDVQEEIEAAEDGGVIRGLMGENEERIKGSVERLEDLFGEGDGEGARSECVRLRYWASLREGLEAWDGKGSQVRLVH